MSDIPDKLLARLRHIQEDMIGPPGDEEAIATAIEKLIDMADALQRARRLLDLCEFDAPADVADLEIVYRGGKR